MRLAAAFAASFLLFMPVLVHAEDGPIGRIESEIEGLKKENAELKKRIEAVEAEGEEVKHGLGMLSRGVEVSGYADAEFILTNRDGDNNRFRIRHLSIFFTKDIQKEWKFFAETEYEDAPRIVSNTATDTVKSSEGTIFVEQLYIEYHPKPSWDLRLGRFLTPAGIWPIYHYPPYVPTQTGPLFYKVIFPEVSDGIQARGSFTTGGSIVDAHLYVTNGSGNPGITDRNENKGAGVRVNADLLTGLSAGASYYRDEDNSGILKNSYGAHLLFSRSRARFQAELARRSNDPDGPENYYDTGAYVQLSYDIGKWTLAGRYDWYDPSSEVSGNGQYRYTGALNYHFAHNVIGKAEFNRNEFDDPSEEDYNEGIFAVVVAIGDL